MTVKIACSLDEIRSLSPDKVKSILDADRQGNYILLDVRQPEEYQEGHIPGAKFIPLGELELREVELEREKKVITYCRSGRRSLGASVLLCGLGFKEVYNMEGGILNWHHELITGAPQEGLELLAGVAEPRDALLLAFRLEKGSWDFYSRISERLGGKSQSLPGILDMEEEHMNGIYDKLAGYWKDEFPTLEELKQKLSGEYTEAGIVVNKALLRFEEDFRDDLEVIEAAVEMECKAYDLYKRMGDRVEGSEVRELFRRLAAEERGHIQRLSGELKNFL